MPKTFDHLQTQIIMTSNHEKIFLMFGNIEIQKARMELLILAWLIHRNEKNPNLCLIERNLFQLVVNALNHQM